jgi:ribosomal protein S18 acetylase RimI-like enzyme
MDTLIFRRTDWDEIEGKWQALVLENYHAAYNGMGEYYNNITTAEAKIENMKPYVIGLPVWSAWSGTRMVGVLMAKISGERMVIFDMFVSQDFRRQGVGRKLVQMAIEESGARLIAAEVNHDNSASQELFKALAFQRRRTSDWLELEVEKKKDGGT